jgi:Ca2+-transporting ATPase
VKGAPDVILDMCTPSLKGGLAVPLSKREREEILNQNSDLADKALRVIAFAYRELPPIPRIFSENMLNKDLFFLAWPE